MHLNACIFFDEIVMVILLGSFLDELKHAVCTGTTTRAEGLKRRLKLAEGHIEAGRLLAFYQVCILYFMENAFNDLNFS